MQNKISIKEACIALYRKENNIKVIKILAIFMTNILL